MLETAQEIQMVSAMNKAGLQNVDFSDTAYKFMKSLYRYDKNKFNSTMEAVRDYYQIMGREDEITLDLIKEVADI